jgi:polar amino acid transport system permease protein
MIKDTSLAFILNVPELTMTANQVNTRAQIYPAEIFLFTAAVYFVLCAGLSWAAHGLAFRLRPGHVTP